MNYLASLQSGQKFLVVIRDKYVRIQEQVVSVVKIVASGVLVQRSTLPVRVKERCDVNSWW